MIVAAVRRVLAPAVVAPQGACRQQRSGPRHTVASGVEVEEPVTTNRCGAIALAFEPRDAAAAKRAGDAKRTAEEQASTGPAGRRQDCDRARPCYGAG
jgi:hypothetical protein